MANKKKEALNFPEAYLNIEIFWMMIEELGEERKLSQTTFDCAKVCEGGDSSKVKVTVSHTSVSTIVSI